MDKLASIRAFTKVVQHNGFAAAARDLRLSRSAVSKHVIELEEELGVQLLSRTTRSVTPTENGQAYYERGLAILADLEEADLAAARSQAEVRGLLRVNAPMSFGTLHLARAVADFMEKYSELRIQLILSDQQIDPVQEGYDVTLRIADLPSSSMIARKIAPALRAICASPVYLAQHGIPQHPDDLRGHACLTYGHLATGNQWKLTGPDGDHWIAIPWTLCTNNAEVLRDAAVGGARHRAPAHFHRRSRYPAGAPYNPPHALQDSRDFDLRDLSGDQASFAQGASVHRFSCRALRRASLLGSGRMNAARIRLP